MNTRVYVARRDCGCIVAAFPANLDKTIKGNLLMVLAKAGYDIDQTTQEDVRLNFHLTCDHNKPPLLAYMDERTAEGRMAIDAGEGVTVGDGVETAADSSSSPAFAENGVGAGQEGTELEGENSFADEPEDDGVDQADVDALASDVTPEAEEADELLPQEEF